MQALLEIGLSNAVLACPAAVFAGLVGLGCRRPALVHALWLLVLVKLITPPLYRVPLPWPREAPPMVVADAVMPPEMPVEVEPIEVPFVEPDWGEAEEIIVEPAAPAMVDDAPNPNGMEAPPAVAWAIGWAEVLAGLWVIGSLGWFTLATGRAWRFSRLLKHSSPAPAGLVERIERLAALVGLPGAPEVRLLPGRLAPMIWGAFRPVMLLPAGLCGQLDDEGLDTLIVHELAHLRRRDPWVRVVEFLALGLFWWHPVAWLARREMRQAEEECCDAWVVRVLPGAARSYAVALVDALDFLSEPRPVAPPLACGIGEVADLKRRLKMILARSTPHALGRFAGLVVLAVAVCLLPMLPSLGEAQAPVPARGEGDLDRIKEELARKMREIEDLKRRAEEIAREQQRLAEARARKDAEKRRVEVKDKVARIEGGSGTTFRLEISGMGNSKEDIEKLTRAIQVALPDNAKVIIVASGQGMGGTSKGPAAGGQSKGDKWHFEWRHDDPKSKSSEPKPAMTPRSGDGMPGMGGSAGAPGMPPGMGGMGGFGGGMGPDRRIETLEKKLDDIMKQLEALRKEMRRPGGGGGGGRGGVPSSSEIPIPPTVAAPRTPATPVAPVAPVAPVPPTPVVPAAPAAPAPGGPTPQ